MNTDYANDHSVGEAVGQQSQMLLRAHQVAAIAHAGQADKLGRPYLTHCERVSTRVSGEKARIVGLLHDTLEKGVGWTATMLRQEGFGEDVVVAIETLTRRADMPDEAFLEATACNQLTRVVKSADLDDNIQQSEDAGLSSLRYRSERQALIRLTRTAPGESRTSAASHHFVRWLHPIGRVVRSLLVELGLGCADRQRNERRGP